MTREEIINLLQRKFSQKLCLVMWRIVPPLTKKPYTGFWRRWRRIYKYFGSTSSRKRFNGRYIGNVKNLEKERTKNKMEKIYPSIMRVMGEIGAIGKTRENTQQGYNFRGIDDVLNNLQPALIKAGVFVVPRMMEVRREEKSTQKGGILTYTTIRAEFDFCSAEDGSKVTASTYGEGMDTSDKSVNKAMSAALKYAIIQIFSIPTEELIDSERDHVEPAVEFITVDQVIEINDLIKETKSDLAKFLKYMGVESGERILASNYQKAVAPLSKKLADMAAAHKKTARQPGDE